MKQTNYALPLAVLAVYGGGVMVDALSRTTAISVLGITATAIIAWLWLQRIAPASLVCTLCFCLVAAGLGAAVTHFATDHHDWSGTSGRWTGQVLDVDCRGHYQRVTVDVDGLGGAVVHRDPGDHIKVGQLITLAGTVRRPQQAGNPGEFDYRRFLEQRGVRWYLEASELQATGQAETSVNHLLHIQQYIMVRLSKLAHPELLQAILLGDRQALTAEQSTGWEQLGITHLMAVSGMHLGILSIVLSRVLLRIPMPQSARWFIMVMFILGYVFLVGARPSSLRAWTIMLLAGAAQLRRRKVDPLHYWSVAALVFFIFRPVIWKEVGFLMSFAASGGILLFLPWIARLPRWVGALMVSFAAQLSLLPILANVFGQVSLVGPLATLAFTPFVMLLLVVGILWILSGGLLDIVLVPVLNALTSGLLWISHYLQPAAVTMALRSFAVHELVVWYGCLVALAVTLRPRQFVRPRQTWARWALALAVLCLWWSLPPTWIRPLQVVAIDVGQGDSLLIRTPYNQAILIDGGGSSWPGSYSEYNVGSAKVLPLLRRLGVDHLDLVVLTHAHEDHLQGLLPVLETFSVGMVWDGGDSHTTRSYQRYLELIYQNQIPYHVVRTGDRFVLPGDVEITVLHPQELLSGTPSDLNNNSVVLHLQYAGRSLLFTGDLDLDGQLDMLRRPMPAVDWLKIPHHGSAAAWFEPWLARLAPSTAVICVGENNRFGHPSPKVLAGLAESGVEVYRTDINGMIATYVWQGLMWTKGTKR